ncbi:MAG: preprotein translocase subunit SecG [Oscillospiraceae bacterium]|nr:MAG: preprotein translocase subunit SecG [Oscillospiraceae bacterium]
MGMLEIIGGFLLIAICAVIIVAVTAQESKSGLGTISGESSGTFFDKNRGKTKEAMLARASTVSGIALAVVTLIVVVVAAH